MTDLDARHPLADRVSATDDDMIVGTIDATLPMEGTDDHKWLVVDGKRYACDAGDEDQFQVGEEAVFTADRREILGSPTIFADYVFHVRGAALAASGFSFARYSGGWTARDYNRTWSASDESLDALCARAAEESGVTIPGSEHW